MIVKLDPLDQRPETLINKVNELIEAFNALRGDYDLHYHETLDTHYNTSYPKVNITDA